jgi:hypothetical protein
MSLIIRKLGDVLLHIYDFPLEAAIYIPETARFEGDTPCTVGGGLGDEASFHDACLENGFKNWLNVAVVSDTYDEVLDKNETALIAAFNEDCQEGGWLWKMMNYHQKGDGGPASPLLPGTENGTSLLLQGQPKRPHDPEL